MGPNKLSCTASCNVLWLSAQSSWLPFWTGQNSVCLPLTQMSGEILDSGDEDRRTVSPPDSGQGWDGEKILYGFKSLKVWSITVADAAYTNRCGNLLLPWKTCTATVHQLEHGYHLFRFQWSNYKNLPIYVINNPTQLTIHPRDYEQSCHWWN